MGDRRYEGFLYGAGLSYGYQWVVGRRWNIEAMLGVGYIRSEYDRYVWKRAGGFWAAAAGTISVRRGPACPSVS